MNDQPFPTEPARNSRRILVVEDDEAIAELLEIILEMAGFQVRLAGSANTALQVVGVFAPDAIVVDIKLPDGSGIELLRKLREERHITAPAMMLTTTIDPVVVADALAVGANEYLTKPFDDRVVVQRLQRLMNCQTA